jgi:hypothetical protein
MRSLLGDDIPGTHPRIRHYERKLYRLGCPLEKQAIYYAPLSYTIGQIIQESRG